ncbi:MAG: M23 family metallopeptidase [Marinilabiliales bacterium]
MLNNNKYYFNPDTLEFVPKRFIDKNIFKHIRIVLVTSCLLFIAYFITFHFVESPFTIKYQNKKESLILKSQNLEKEILAASEKLNNLHKDENKKLRVFLNMEKIPSEYFQAGYGGTKINTPLDNIIGAEKLAVLRKKLYSIQKQVIIQKQIMEQVVNKSKDFNKMLLNYPYMVPVEIEKSKYRGPYGIRKDPITGMSSFHPGLDLICPFYTHVYATGDGVVVKAEYNPYGYGNMVDIDHGNGYMTRYAHLSKIMVRPGKKVKRGEHIGDVGSTGRSVGPHLHYEVRINNITQNPVNYIPDNLSDNDFHLIINRVNNNK